LDDIEYKILRTQSPTALTTRSNPLQQFWSMNRAENFTKDDPRSTFAVTWFDFRINFALCKGNLSSPNLCILRGAELLDKQLTLAARDFVNEHVTVLSSVSTQVGPSVQYSNGEQITMKKDHTQSSIPHKTVLVTLPKLFKDFLHDFGGTPNNALRTVLPFATNLSLRLDLFFVRPDEFTFQYTHLYNHSTSSHSDGKASGMGGEFCYELDALLSIDSKDKQLLASNSCSQELIDKMIVQGCPYTRTAAALQVSASSSSHAYCSVLSNKLYSYLNYERYWFWNVNSIDNLKAYFNLNEFQFIAQDKELYPFRLLLKKFKTSFQYKYDYAEVLEQAALQARMTQFPTHSGINSILFFLSALHSLVSSSWNGGRGVDNETNSEELKTEVFRVVEDAVFTTVMKPLFSWYMIQYTVLDGNLLKNRGLFPELTLEELKVSAYFHLQHVSTSTTTERKTTSTSTIPAAAATDKPYSNTISLLNSIPLYTIVDSSTPYGLILFCNTIIESIRSEIKDYYASFMDVDKSPINSSLTSDDLVGICVYVFSHADNASLQALLPGLSMLDDFLQSASKLPDIYVATPGQTILTQADGAQQDNNNSKKAATMKLPGMATFVKDFYHNSMMGQLGFSLITLKSAAMYYSATNFALPTH
jgi:hypothetical protein